MLKASDYVSAVRNTIVAGGCNCSRVSFIGACLGAKYGIEGIPLPWIKNTNAALCALDLSMQLLGN